jgi:hypothetical protein
MTLGESRVDLGYFDYLVAHTHGATASDLVFRHLALVTNDAEAAWQRAKMLGRLRSPRGELVTLPQSSGGVTAGKFFRESEGQPLCNSPARIRFGMARDHGGWTTPQSRSLMR